MLHGRLTLLKEQRKLVRKDWDILNKKRRSELCELEQRKSF